MKFELNLTAVDLEGKRTDLIANGDRLIGTDLLHVLCLSEAQIEELYYKVCRAGEYHTLVLTYAQAQELTCFARTCTARVNIPVDVLRAHMTFEIVVDDDGDSICVPDFDVNAIVEYLRRVGA